MKTTKSAHSGLLLLALLFAVGAGCRDKGSERWACEFITYSNDVVAVYWSGEFVVDRASFLNRIGGHNHAFEVTRRRYMLSQLNIESRELIERMLTATDFAKAGSAKTNCMAEFNAETFPAETRIMDGDCQNRHALLLKMLSAKAILVGNRGIIELDYSPYTSGK